MAAASLARPSGVMPPLFFLPLGVADLGFAAVAPPALIMAQRALAAAPMRARAAALIFRLPTRAALDAVGLAVGAGAVPPDSFKSRTSSFCISDLI